MTMPKIYDPNRKTNKPKPMPFLTITPDLAIAAVSEDGEHLAIITTKLGVSVQSAEGALDERGYATDWAEWDDEGRFMRLCEPVAQ